jgi:hypothetical protein
MERQKDKFGQKQPRIKWLWRTGTYLLVAAGDFGVLLPDHRHASRDHCVTIGFECKGPGPSQGGHILADETRLHVSQGGELWWTRIEGEGRRERKEIV